MRSCLQLLGSRVPGQASQPEAESELNILLTGSNHLTYSNNENLSSLEQLSVVIQHIYFLLYGEQPLRGKKIQGAAGYTLSLRVLIGWGPGAKGQRLINMEIIQEQSLTFL